MRLKELFRIKAQPYEARKALVQALNECGYATKIVEHKASSSVTSSYWVAAFEDEAQVDPSEKTTMPQRFGPPIGLIPRNPWDILKEGKVE